MQKVITLATLAQATPQEVFDQVAKHMLTQMQKSRSDCGATCLYRFGNLKCAAGCLIADDEYDPRMEANSNSGWGGGWNNLVDNEVVTPRHQELIIRLQKIHDNFETFDWAEALKDLACEFNLDFSGA